MPAWYLVLPSGVQETVKVPAPMNPATNILFTSDLWLKALERYASDTRLSVTLFDVNGRVVFGPIHPTPLFQLFEEQGYDPGMFAECARRCLAQTDSRPAVVVSEVYGLATVGTSLVLEGQIVGAAVGGYAFVDFSQLSEVQRLAKDAGIKFERLWEVARAQKPVPQQRLILNGELLQVLGDALLRENYRTRQYEGAVSKLEDTVKESARIHHELQHTAWELRENQERLARELAATQQLQAASSLLIEGGNSDALYRKIVDAAVVIMQSDMASLQVLHPERGLRGELRLLHQRGFNPQAAAFWEWVRLDSESSCGAALRAGQRVIVPDVETCEFMTGTEDLKHYRKMGIRAVQSTPLLSRDGRLLGMVSTHWSTSHSPAESQLRMFDVLARQAADLLERNRAVMAMASLAAIVESSEDAIVGKDLNGVITSWNKGAERLFGYTAPEAVGKSITILIPPDRLDEEPAMLERIRNGKSIEHYETVRRRKDGELFYISLTVSPIYDSQGRIVGASKIARDITERKKAEEALREAGERFRFMAESMPQKIFTAQPNGEIDYFNRQWMEYTDITFKQVKESGWMQYIHPDDAAENARRWQHSIDTGTPFYFEHRLRGADGVYRWHFSRAVPMRNADGDITMWIGSNTDIQPVRDQEDRLRKSEKMAAAGQLAASMAHEVNNPLAAITNALYLLEKNASLDDAARFFLSTAATELARVSRIVKQSLSYYRVGITPSNLNLGKIVNESLKIFHEKILKAGVELNPRIHCDRGLVGFPDELRQVVDNLLLNAVEAMPSGGRLSISVRESFDWNDQHHHRSGVRLTIADTGSGISREHRKRIFEPFFTTKAEKGTGLGLWVLQGIISKHEGTMSLRTSDKKHKSGTVISIFLPSHTHSSEKFERPRPGSAA